MNLKRLWVILKARNREFFRDKAAFGWNFLFPFLIIAGFAIIFGGQHQSEFKVGLVGCTNPVQSQCIPEPLAHLKYVKFIGFNDRQQGLDKLRHHKIDLLITTATKPYSYWVTDSSPKGYVVEKMMAAQTDAAPRVPATVRRSIDGKAIRYIDWLFPGILGMNMMFSALYGVGYVVVRYRKNGVLKRLKATPLTAFEYLTAQMLSRIFVLMFSVSILWAGCELIFDFQVNGSYILLALVFFLGGLSLTALGLVIASRGTSEEFTNGLLNFITWPMMFLSEVWFSIEGAPEWLQHLARLFPLTHMLTAVRKVMNDGATFGQISGELVILTISTLIFLTIGALLFSWNK